MDPNIPLAVATALASPFIWIGCMRILGRIYWEKK